MSEVRRLFPEEATIGQAVETILGTVRDTENR